MKLRPRALPFAVVCLALFFTYTALGRNPPKLKGKTPPDAYVASEPEWVPAERTPGLMAPAEYDRSCVSTPKTERYFPPQTTTPFTRRLGSTARPWWQIEATAVDVQTTPFRGLVSSAGASRPIEPVLTSLTKSGVTYTVAAWMDWDYLGAFQSKLWAARITHNASGSGIVEPAVELNRTTGYDRVADPVLASNPYTDDIRSQSLQLFAGFPLKLVPIARFNHIMNKMMVVWHDRPSTSNSDSAIYLAYFTPSSIASTKPVPITVNNAAGYQFQPTVDNDDAGNMMISYFSNELDLVNGFYKPYAILRDSSGFNTVKGPTAIDAASGNWPGDYKDIWYFGFTDSAGARWHTVHNFTGSPPDTRITGVK